MANALMLAAGLMAFLAACFYWGWWWRGRRLPAPGPRRCQTLTFLYSDGVTKTFHRCRGYVFTRHLGNQHAPAGAHVVDRWGGSHLT